MKLEPMMAARAPGFARAAIARASASERSVWTLSRSKPGVASRTGSAPVASSSRSKRNDSPELVTAALL
jgi:hypothetical protein